jgi:superoxide dismutase, Fe-Mn family
MAFTLPELPYDKNALEPHIDAKTMEIHHGKHHQAYVDKGNDALKGTALEGSSDPELVCRRLGEIPADKRGPARNNVGGHFNHSLFWQIMAPAGGGGGGAPSGDLAKAIDTAFGSLDAFKEKFAAAAAGRFGSGWAWLCVKSGKLEVCSTANQDNPLMKDAIGDAAGCGGEPILGLDVWEHAYYLNYQNKRPDYVKAWWNVVNWSMVGELYKEALTEGAAAR